MLARRVSTKCINSELARFIEHVIASESECDGCSSSGVALWVVVLVAGLSLVPIWVAYRYYTRFRDARDALLDQTIEETPYHNMDTSKNNLLVETY